MTDRLVKIRFIGEGITTVAGQVTALGKSVSASADKLTSADKSSVKFRRGLTDIGNTAGKVGLVAAAGLGAIIVSAANFEQAMSRVKAATHASASTMDDLRTAAIVAGRDTVFSATEAADAITAMSKAGVSAKDILGGGLNGALSLASAGELDVATAADIAATAMNQFGLAGKDIPHIADLLAAAAGKAQGEVSDMAASLKFVGPVAHQMGISIEETTGTIAELASQGIIGEQAGTSLRGMLTALTSPSMQAAKTMKSLGIELYDANGQFVGLRGIAGQLGDTMGKLTNAERDQALGRIFGNEQITAARILYAGGAEAVDKWTAAVNDQGYAADTAAIKLDNLKGDVEQLRGSLETAFIGSGSGSQGPLRGFVQGLTDAVNEFNKLPPAAQSSVSSLLAITAVTGGTLWFGAKVIGGIASTRTALDNLGVDATRVGRTMRTAFAAGAIIEGLNVIETSLDGIFNQTLDSSNLGRSLTALGQGKVTGEFLKKYGSDLKGFSDDIGLATDKANSFQRTVGKIPVIGGFIAAPPWQKSVVDAAGNLKTLDEALAGLVESGQADQAAAIFDRLTQVATENGHSVKDVTAQFEQYEVAIGNAKDATLSTSGAAQLMSDAMTGLINPTSKVGKVIAESASDLAAQAKALEASRKAASETAHQFAGLGSKVDDTKVSLDAWVKDLQKQANALRDFTKNAQTAGKKGLKDGLIKELEAAGPAGALRMKQLADASETEIRRANRAWASQQRAIRNYVNTVGGVPPAVTTTLDVKTAAAEAALARIDREIRNIPKQWRTDYYVIQHNAINKPRVTPGQAGQADGGTIPGPRYPYGDKVMTPTAPGEEVISDRHGQATKWRPLLKAINAGMADGGTVGRLMPAGAMSAQLAGAGIDYDRLASATSGGRLMSYHDQRQAMLWALRTALSETPVLRASADLSMLAGMS